MAPLALAIPASPKARATRPHKRRWRFWMAKQGPLGRKTLDQQEKIS
jgi:hypothetical protein